MRILFTLVSDYEEQLQYGVWVMLLMWLICYTLCSVMIIVILCHNCCM